MYTAYKCGYTCMANTLTARRNIRNTPRAVPRPGRALKAVEGVLGCIDLPGQSAWVAALQAAGR